MRGGHAITPDAANKRISGSARPDPSRRARKVVVLFLACGLGVLLAMWGILVAASRASARNAARPSIKICVQADETSSDSEMSWARLQVADFEKYRQKRGWDEIDLRVTTTVGDSMQKYVASTIAGEGADIILLSPTGIPQFDDHDLLEPLDGYIGQWDDYREGHINDKVLDMCRGTRGEILGVTSARMGPFFYVVRRDWLERLGLAAPETWDEAYEVWKAFTHDDPDGNGEDDTYGFLLSMRTDGGTHVTRLAPFMLAAGVRWYETDDQGRIVPAFNTPEAEQVLEFIKKCYEENLFGRDVMYRTEQQSPSTKFLSEDTAGMAWGFPPDWFKSAALRYGKYDKLQVIPFLWQDEAAKKERRYGCSASMGSLLCIMKNSRNKDAAWKYIAFCCSRDRMARYFSRRGAPAYRGRYLGRFGLFAGQAPWLPLRNDFTPDAKVDPRVEKLVRPLDAFVVPQPPIAAWSEIRTMMSEVFVDYYLGRYPSAKAALDEAEKQFREIVARHEKSVRRRGKGAAS